MEWSEKEVTLMKSSFLKGQQIKEIARKMGRSPTSINKALSRFGIRQAAKKRIPSPIASLKKKSLNLRNHHLDIKLFQENWVHFKDVLFWLERQNHHIHRIRYGHPEETYLYNGKIMSKNQLVLMANKLRVDRKLPVFLVNHITHA